MRNINHIKCTVSLLLFTGLFSTGVSAGLVNGTHWVIKPGDSLYKISRDIFPGDAKKQHQLRKGLMQQNPQVFKNGASNLSIGDKLQLPDFAITTIKPVVPTPALVKPAVVKPVITKTKAVKTPEVTKVSAKNSKDVIGQVVINVGELSAENRGAIRQLNRRSKILRGDTISTGSDSHTQIRLKDGALLSLRPYTNLKIADYRYNGRQDGTEQSIIELLKGGFRTITGAIGHINKQNYKVRTSVATIGIRGTHYSLVLCDDSCSDDKGNKVKAGLYGGVSDGAVVVENKTGIHRFNNDQFFQIISDRAKPIAFIKPPGILKMSPRQVAKVKDKLKKIKDKLSDKLKHKHRRLPVPFEPNQPDLAERPAPVADLDPTVAPVKDLAPQKAPNGSAVLIGYNHLDPDNNMSGAAVPILISDATNNEMLIYDKEITGTPFVEKIPYAGKEFSTDANGTFVHELAMKSPDGAGATLVPSSLGRDLALGVNWGRWNGDFTVLENGQRVDTKSDFHFIYSENITPREKLATITGTSVMYSLLGNNGTLPTDNNGNIASVLPSIDLDVNFTSQQITAYTVSADVAGISYQAGATFVPFDKLDKNFLINGSGCGNTCSGEASIVFVGANAEGALNSYVVKDTLGASSITGTALLTK